ncbi:hypothetical protein [Hyphomicrobium sulfonivorans]|uniref:hypothetical protein n=1 Tax=Hyphomicrobium sulfonivorans TaxID=121290 RepID=UPI00156E4661|nr:hypothetical protein [Hyphomicrobium sulfonivorans]MBI1650227.1 hypothetical protein [Hyphomicrobium sulfonivorans]NSL72411.1 hypothetical protein [Hyphomicrobium sulfonivorans]
MLVVAVALLSGGLPALHDILTFEAHAHGLTGAHSHTSAQSHGDAIKASYAAAGQQAPASDHHPASGDQDCTHVHVHCCAVSALLGSSTLLPRLSDAGQLRLERQAALPYGQLPYPPMRPPRTAA